MTTSPTTTALPVILHLPANAPGAARYWNALARRLAGKVDAIDANRWGLRELRAHYPHLIGKRIYRASTGGKWGKSSQIVTL